MSNSIDNFLAKASPEQQEKFKADVQNAITGRQTEAERNAESAQKTALRNDPTKGQEQTPQEAQKDQNAVDKALAPQVKAETKQIGQTMEKHLSPPQNDRDR